ncbi:MAG: hypothetical protein WBF13_09735 [Candidatus Zixiibacteriota bacterium]
MKITNRHIKFAKLLLEGQLKAPEIAVQCGISERQGRNWKKRPEIERLMNSLSEEAMRNPKRILARYAKRAVQVLVKLLEVRQVQQGDTIHQEFVYKPELVRKAAGDILRLANIGVETKEQTSPSIFIIRKTAASSDVEKRALKLAKRVESTGERALENQKPAAELLR